MNSFHVSYECNVETQYFPVARYASRDFMLCLNLSEFVENCGGREVLVIMKLLCRS